MKSRLLIAAHLILYLIAYTSWLWLDYRIIAIAAVGHLIMLVVMNGCPLSHAQFPGDQDKRFYEWGMGRLGVKFTPRNRGVIRILMQYVVPFIIIGLGAWVQIGLSIRPLLQL